MIAIRPRTKGAAYGPNRCRRRILAYLQNHEWRCLAWISDRAKKLNLPTTLVVYYFCSSDLFVVSLFFRQEKFGCRIHFIVFNVPDALQVTRACSAHFELLTLGFPMLLVNITETQSPAEQGKVEAQRCMTKAPQSSLTRSSPRGP